MSEYWLGSMKLGGTFDGLVVSRYPKSETDAFLDAAWRLGFRTIDTAPVYIKGAAEDAIGQFKGGRFHVCTKVGVDISGIVPRLDYSLEGMKSSFASSQLSLKDHLVAHVAIHNPPPSLVCYETFQRFADWILSNEMATSVGVCLLDPGQMPSIAEISNISWVSIESSMLKNYHDTAAHKLIIRSAFAGGNDLRSKETSVVERIIQSKLINLRDQFNPWATIVAPATIQQLKSYEQLFSLPISSVSSGEPLPIS